MSMTSVNNEFIPSTFKYGIKEKRELIWYATEYSQNGEQAREELLRILNATKTESDWEGEIAFLIKWNEDDKFEIYPKLYPLEEPMSKDCEIAIKISLKYMFPTEYEQEQTLFKSARNYMDKVLN